MRIEFGFWVKDDDGVGYPAADSRMEARLNMFEYQIEACLRGSHPWVALWQSYFTAETMTSNAVWFEDEEGRTKAAARELTIPCRVNPECLPYAHRYDEPQEVPAIPSPLAELIAEFKLRGGGDFLKYVLGIETVLKAEALPVGSVYPRLTTVYLRIPEAITPPGEKPNIILEGDVLDLPDD